MNRTSKIVMVLAVLVAGSMIAGAALLPYFGRITTTASVSQSVWIDGHTYPDEIIDTVVVVAGDTVSVVHYLHNRASVPITISFETGSDPDITTTYWVNNEQVTTIDLQPGVSTSLYIYYTFDAKMISGDYAIVTTII